jgi:hypothetical protein
MSARHQHNREESAGRAAPGTLYHYTNAAGLKGIVESGVLRAPHIAFMNDTSECMQGRSCLNMCSLKMPAPTRSNRAFSGDGKRDRNET